MKRTLRQVISVCNCRKIPERLREMQQASLVTTNKAREDKTDRVQICVWTDSEITVFNTSTICSTHTDLHTFPTPLFTLSIDRTIHSCSAFSGSKGLKFFGFILITSCVCCCYNISPHQKSIDTPMLNVLPLVSSDFWANTFSHRWHVVFKTVPACRYSKKGKTFQRRDTRHSC
jgi:hypothetical protein